MSDRASNLKIDGDGSKDDFQNDMDGWNIYVPGIQAFFSYVRACFNRPAQHSNSIAGENKASRGGLARTGPDSIRIYSYCSHSGLGWASGERKKDSVSQVLDRLLDGQVSTRQHRHACVKDAVMDGKAASLLPFATAKQQHKGWRRARTALPIGSSARCIDDPTSWSKVTDGGSCALVLVLASIFISRRRRLH